MALFAGAFLILFAVVTTWLVINSAGRVRWVEHTLEVEREISEAQATLYAAESAARGYISTGNPGLLSNPVGADRALWVKLGEISSLTSDNPRQSAALRGVEQSAAARLAMLARAVALKRAGSDAAAQKQLTDPLGIRQENLFREATDGMRAEENRLYVVRLKQAEDSRRALLVLSTLTGVATLAFTLAWISNRSCQADPFAPVASGSRHHCRTGSRNSMTSPMSIVGPVLLETWIWMGLRTYTPRLCLRTTK